MNVVKAVSNINNKYYYYYLYLIFAIFSKLPYRLT